MFKIGRLNILPARALKYFLGSLCLLAVSVCLVEYAVLPALESKDKLTSFSWWKENRTLFQCMLDRNKATPADPVWRSVQWPVSTTKTKSKRILVMGDSYIWGDGYANMNSLWWRQLQKELARRGYNDVEVIACGMCGASTKMELEWGKEIIPRYSPDLVIWGYVTNDPDAAQIYAKDPKARGNSWVHLFHCSEDRSRLEMDESAQQGSAQKEPAIVRARNICEKVVPDLTYHLFRLRRSNLARAANPKVDGYEYGPWELALLDGKNFATYKKTIDELGSFAQTTDIPMFMIALPNGFTQAPSEKKEERGRSFFELVKSYFVARYAPVQPLFEKAGVPFINTLDDFVAVISADKQMQVDESPLRLGVNPGNGHPGPLANHFYAQEAADLLEAKYRQCLGPRDSAAKKERVSIRVNDCVPVQMKLEQREHGDLTLQYPVGSDRLLYMPIRKQHIQLNLESPARIKEIDLTGAGIENADVYVTNEDPQKHFDDGSLRELGTKYGSTLKWTLAGNEGENLDSVVISANFKTADHRIQCRIACAER